MTNLHVLFPTLVYETSMKEHVGSLLKLIKKKNVKETNEWRCDTKTTFDSDMIIGDNDFDNIIQSIMNEVKIFAANYGCYGEPKVVDAWVNVAEPGSSQEYHIHPNCHFSVVYYIKTPENCGNIVFRSHEADFDMFMLPLQEYKPASYKTWAFCPSEGKVLIFRSNMKHMVEKNISNDTRICLAANFVINDNDNVENCT